MSKKRKKYLVTTDSEAFACSLVTSPAMEQSFVAFAEDKPLVEKFADEKKHMITGVVCIPQKPIYRRNADGEEYDIVFSAEAIEKMAKDYLKEYRQNEVTLQHQEETDGVYLVEQWIKTDMVYDKSLSVGLSKELPIGSWFQTYYVDSNDVWQRIENGELQGFSLECMLGLEEFSKQIEQNDNNMNMETNDMGFWNKMRSVLAEVFTSVSMSKQNDDVDTETSETNKVEHLEEETPIEQPTVETPTEAISSPSDNVSEAEATTDKVDENNEPSEPKNEEVVEQPKNDEPKVEQPNPLEDLVKNLTEEIKALKEANDSLVEKVKELGKRPSVEPIKTNGSSKSSDNYANWRDTMRSYLGR